MGKILYFLCFTHTHMLHLEYLLLGYILINSQNRKLQSFLQFHLILLFTPQTHINSHFSLVLFFALSMSSPRWLLLKWEGSLQLTLLYSSVFCEWCAYHPFQALMILFLLPFHTRSRTIQAFHRDGFGELLISLTVSRICSAFVHSPGIETEHGGTSCSALFNNVWGGHP